VAASADLKKFVQRVQMYNQLWWYRELRWLCDRRGAVHYQTTAYKTWHKLRSCLYIRQKAMDRDWW